MNKSLVNFIKSICFVIIISAVITVVTVKPEQTKMEAIFTVPVLLTMFGFGLTMYVFLHNSVITLRKDILLKKQEKTSRMLETTFGEISQDLKII